MTRGLLLINLGTPDSFKKRDVRRYLREFLADARVINLPAPLRYLLLYGVILPFRTKRSSKAYEAIWTEYGSPLLYHSQQLLNKIQQQFQSDNVKVALGMRYGNPSIEDALQTLADCEHLTILPLYPQYASASTGSSIAHTLKKMQYLDVFPNIEVIRDFHQHPSFIFAQAELIKPYLNQHDHVLFSYHGVPENHLLKDDCKTNCLKACSPTSTRFEACYRQQCHHTTRLITEKLGLSPKQFSLAFQSRLGRTPWIKPYTDNVIEELARAGVKRLAITCPSFVADCLETIEEIGLQAAEQWQQLGGTQLTLVPALNDNDSWVKAILDIIQNPDATTSKPIQ